MNDKEIKDFVNEFLLEQEFKDAIDGWDDDSDSGGFGSQVLELKVNQADNDLPR